MSVIHQEQERLLDARMLAPLGGLGVALLGLLLRLWYLQVYQADALVERAEELRTTRVETLAPRGLIVDRKGRVLAGVRSEVVVTGVPAILAKHPESLHRLAALVGAPAKKLKTKLDAGAWRPYLPTPVYIGASIQVATRIAEEPDRYPGLEVSSQPMRYYPDTKTYAHILGYVWTPSASDVERMKALGKKPADFVGKIGLEYVHEEELMGTPGAERLVLDNKRRPIRSAGRDSAVPGKKLALSLDADLEQLAMERLAGRRGAVVALDPRNGEVLCLVSSPTYDAGLFRGGISQEDYKSLQSDPAKPQINRAIATGYAPGSTFKIVTTLAGMLAGQDPTRKVVNCPGYYLVGRRRMRCMSVHGTIGFHRAMQKSCNTFFATVGVQAGEDALREACKLVGLGQKTGVDLLGERPGVVPTEEWIAKWRKPPVWYKGDTVNFSIGQGEVSPTPIQMATMMSLVANRGVAYRPHFVRNAGGQPVVPEVIGKIDLPATFWDALHSALLAVVEEGTAARSRIQGFQWAGKTGSAENRRMSQTHSWFVGFAPYQNPRFAIAVVVENAGHGGDVAAPIAGDLVRRYFRAETADIEVQSASRPAASTAAPALAPSPNER